MLPQNYAYSGKVCIEEQREEKVGKGRGRRDKGGVGERREEGGGKKEEGEGGGRRGESRMYGRKEGEVVSSVNTRDLKNK